MTIPARKLVDVIPGVLGAGGNPLSLNAVMFSPDESIPIGAALAFTSLATVQDFFGPTSDEAILAERYFAGFVGCTTLPSTLYFYRYNSSAAAGYLRSGSLAALTLAQLQLLSGTLVVVADGETVTSATINLAAASSFSNAASLIQTGLRVAGGIFSGTAVQTAASTTMTVSAVASGALHVGDEIVGTGVAAGTTVVAQLTGPAGGAGTYQMSNSTGFASTGITVASNLTVTYDPQLAAFVITSELTGASSSLSFATGTLATGLALTSATGAVLSAGAAAATPAGAFAALQQATQNFATFMTLFEPDTAGKVAWAQVANSTGQRYAYVGWDTDVSPTTGDQPNCFARQTADFNGRIAVWGVNSRLVAAFICGMTASINRQQPNGRITYAFRRQAGLPIDVTDETVSNNLDLNGYNYYAAFATANQQFVGLQEGVISGEWRFIDEYINQIGLNSDLQLAGVDLLSNLNSVPYQRTGYNAIRSAFMGPIQDAKVFGAIREGVALSPSQIVQLNTAAGGIDIATSITQLGFYLLIQDPGADVRVDRGPPITTLWYTGGGSVHKLRLSSIDIL